LPDELEQFLECVATERARRKGRYLRR
jgi:hypothetical protein